MFLAPALEAGVRNVSRDRARRRTRAVRGERVNHGFAIRRKPRDDDQRETKAPAFVEELV